MTFDADASSNATTTPIGSICGISVVGVGELDRESEFLEAAHPNPSFNSTTVGYRFKDFPNQTAGLFLHDMLGTLQIQVPIYNREGQIVRSNEEVRDEAH